MDAGQAALAAAPYVSGNPMAPSDAREAMDAAQREEALHRPLAPAEPVLAAPPLVMQPPPEPKPEAAVAKQPAELDTPSSSRQFEAEHQRDTHAAEVPPPPSHASGHAWHCHAQRGRARTDSNPCVRSGAGAGERIATRRRVSAASGNALAGKHFTTG